MYFTAKKSYNFYGTDLYVNVWGGAFRTQSNIYGGASLRKSQKSVTIDVLNTTKYTSGIGFTIEKVYRMWIFIWNSQSRFQDLSLPYLVSQITKKYVGLTKNVQFARSFLLLLTG